MAYSTAFVIVFGLVQIALVIACNCNLKHPQTQYKEGKFVVKAKVVGKYANSQALGSSVLISYVEYVVRIDRIFKGKSKKFGVQEQTEISIYTPDNSLLMRSSFYETWQKISYFWFIQLRSLHISSCDWIEEWGSITREQKKGLKIMYKKPCKECEVPAVSGGQLLMQIQTGGQRAPAALNELYSLSGLWNSQGRCMYNPIDSWQYHSLDCETKYTYCVKKNAGYCGWENNDVYTTCFTKREVQWVKKNLSSSLRGRSLRIGNYRIGCSDLGTSGDFEECLEREVYQIVTQNIRN